MRGSGLLTPTEQEKTVESKSAAERRPLPDLGHVRRAGADHPEQVTAPAQLLERRDRVGPRNQVLERPVPPESHGRCDVALGAKLRGERPQVRLHRADFTIAAASEPEHPEPRRVRAEVRRQTVVHPPGAFHRPRDQRLPEIEDDRPVLHFLSFSICFQVRVLTIWSFVSHARRAWAMPSSA